MNERTRWRGSAVDFQLPASGPVHHQQHSHAHAWSMVRIFQEPELNLSGGHAAEEPAAA